VIAALLFLSISIGYGVTILLILRGWKRIPVQYSQSQRKVSILVVYRNEIEHIKPLLFSLKAQNYPQELMEFVFIDDHSEDDGSELLQNELNHFLSEVQHLSLPKDKIGKKNGIELGVDVSKNEWILMTDADCIVPPNWVSSMAGMGHADFVSGPVAYKASKSILGKLVALDFISMITLGGALISKGSPVLANGANMMFKKACFKEVGGYAGNHNIVSGDDIFLLDKFASHNKSVAFNKSNKAIVETAMVNSFKLFVNQRVRWAKKTQYSKRTSKHATLQILTLSYLAFFISPLIGVLSNRSEVWVVIGFAWMIKLIIDLIYFWHMLKFFNRLHLLLYILLIEIIHPIYIVSIAVLSLFKSFTWKQRSVNYG
jgi:biofilm PGA synthesis N-glycosyltransferase PgaC